MWRAYDWLCSSCGALSEELVQYPSGNRPPDFIHKKCLRCDNHCKHGRRRVNLVARYMGEKVLSPRVKGGNFDTLGFEKAPPLPEFTGTTGKEFREFCHSAEYRSAKSAQAAVKDRNKAKRARAVASKRDPNLSFRHNKLPGDPNFKD